MLAVSIGCTPPAPAVSRAVVQDSLLPSGTTLPYDLEVPEGAGLVGTIFPSPSVDPPPTGSGVGFSAMLLLTDDAQTVLGRMAEQAGAVGYTRREMQQPYPSITLESKTVTVEADANGSASIGGTESTIVILVANPKLLDDGPGLSDAEFTHAPVDEMPFSTGATGTDDIPSLSIESFGEPLEFDVVEGSRVVLAFQSQGLAEVLNGVFVVTGDMDRVLEGYRAQMIDRGFSGNAKNPPTSSDVKGFRVLSDGLYCPAGCGSYGASVVVPPSGPGLLWISASNRS